MCAAELTAGTFPPPPCAAPLAYLFQTAGKLDNLWNPSPARLARNEETVSEEKRRFLEMLDQQVQEGKGAAF